MLSRNKKVGSATTESQIFKRVFAKAFNNKNKNGLIEIERVRTLITEQMKGNLANAASCLIKELEKPNFVSVYSFLTNTLHTRHSGNYIKRKFH